ncbi:CAIB/BAIF family protein [Gonapodya prolifera JEL478]|uniref:CAIB/BAIF family protein n=1 Tax=Gonapodya prolifera (strain JEL478) TaxID=1344416 RepID=A0A139AY95_GONPJ|nr:CAIB/BAIF family protein [Gonapodya prolifera JEL478]|eukprot:KXS21677.1 CAIB/BAIF family protein [Gonapodya prolifera JEL478]
MPFLKKFPAASRSFGIQPKKSPSSSRSFSNQLRRSKPLDGITVLEVGQLVAGPFAGSLLGYFGADVIKIEPPSGGDAIRTWRVLDENDPNRTSLWWRSIGRNKKSVALDMRLPEGRRLLKERIVPKAHVLIENFKPGVMEKWGLGPDDLLAVNPNLIINRISGYGQTGPNASLPGFASVCEGMGGLRFLQGFPGEPSVRANISLGDTLAGLHSVIGILLSLVAQKQVPAGTKGGSGQVVDVALYESVFSLLEAVIPEYDRTGLIRQPSGNTVTGIVPTSAFDCADGKSIIIGANGDSLFQRLCHAMGRQDLADSPDYKTNAGRVKHADYIYGEIGKWCSGLSSADVEKTLRDNGIPAGLIYNARDIVEDAHYNARGMFETVDVLGKPLKIPGKNQDLSYSGFVFIWCLCAAYTPKLSATPGETLWPGPELGEHTEEVLRRMGVPSEEIDSFEEAGFIRRYKSN